MYPTTNCGWQDIKPSNIGVSADNDVRLLDFGLARAKAEIMTGYVTTPSLQSSRDHAQLDALHTERSLIYSTNLYYVYKRSSIYTCCVLSDQKESVCMKVKIGKIYKRHDSLIVVD